MKKYILTLLFAGLISCQTISIKDKTYKVSNATTEIGSIGLSKSWYIKNDFLTKIFPILNEKIRVDVTVIPFDKKSNNIFLKKSKFNQNQEKIKYIDSLEVKPEFVTIDILDISGYISQINSENNTEVIRYLKDVQKAKVITSIATKLSIENISKIKLADTYYLNNIQDKKYTLVLYKSNKKSETIDLQSGVVLGYQLSKCCWAISKKNKWYLSDIVRDCNSCKGSTQVKIKEKKNEKNLYKM